MVYFSRKFFEELGPIKVKELKPKPTDITKDDDVSASNKEMSTLEKVNLWLPTDKAKPNSLDEHKKLDLLSQLNAIDDGRSSPYTPSFNNADKKSQNGFSHHSPESQGSQKIWSPTFSKFHEIEVHDQPCLRWSNQAHTGGGK